MPYPKNIRCPEVFAAYVAERQAKLARFDALRAEGQTAAQAAAAIGMTKPGVRSLRRGLEELIESGPQLGELTGTSRIDLGLALLTVLRKPGETLGLEDIAAWCGCTRETIRLIELRAKNKLRTKLIEACQGTDFAEEVEALFGGVIAS